MSLKHNRPGESITGVGLLSEDDGLWSLPRPARHATLFALAVFRDTYADPCRQGFTTSAGRFVDRIEARRIAEANGQISPTARSSIELLSEDIW